MDKPKNNKRGTFKKDKTMSVHVFKDQSKQSIKFKTNMFDTSKVSEL